MQILTNAPPCIDFKIKHLTDALLRIAVIL